ncbi:MAG: hypothetical protein LBP74_07200 [Treponema sp.]|jgi:hypothetical protein|nr:hypothetical protein [Treponema sp.]
MHRTINAGICRAARGIRLSLLLGAAALLLSCQEPVPLHGSWADNLGNEITFIDDETFNAFIVSSLAPGNTIMYQGTWTVLLNILTFQCSEPQPLRIVSEWDIRGNILYLDWVTEDGRPVRLVLYKIAN